MLVDFLSEKKTISYAGCLTQMYFIYVLANIDSCLLVVMAFDSYVAICDPFHYVTIMNRRRCVLLVAFSCSLPHVHSLLHILLLNQLTFCNSSVVHHFLCDINPLLKLSCSSIFVNDLTIKTEGLVFWWPPSFALFSCMCESSFQFSGSPQLQGNTKPSPPVAPTLLWWPCFMEASFMSIYSPCPATLFRTEWLHLSTRFCPPCSTLSFTVWETKTWREVWGSWWPGGNPSLLGICSWVSLRL